MDSGQKPARPVSKGQLFQPDPFGLTALLRVKITARQAIRSLSGVRQGIKAAEAYNIGDRLTFHFAKKSYNFQLRFWPLLYQSHR